MKRVLRKKSTSDGTVARAALRVLSTDENEKDVGLDISWAGTARRHAITRHMMDDAAGQMTAYLEIDEDLVKSPEHKSARTTSIDFDGELEPALLLHQDLAEGNGGQAWPAGMALTRYLLRRRRDELKQSSVSVSVFRIWTQRLTHIKDWS